MSKYDYKYEVDIEDYSSIGQILGMINPRSTVLEFGCATGIMTRFMKEKLKCNVYIVEIDEKAYKDASKFAVGGYCGDIEKYEWLAELKDIKVDYILFADVLEHLYYPQDVLRKVKGLLKDDGKLIFSVPNIAHGDLLINLYKNQFKYTPLGLLDDTHIRFFAYHSLKPLAEGAGYRIVREQYTSRGLFTTEQADFIPEEERDKYETIMSEHQLSDVYQFVCQLEKKEYADKKQTQIVSTIAEKEHMIETRIYFDYGEGFFEKHKQAIFTERSQDLKYTFTVRVPENVKNIRFDPIEGLKCIVQDLKITSLEKEYTYINLNGICIGDSEVFNVSDPQFLVPIGDRGEVDITITATIIPLGLDIWSPVVNLLTEKHDRHVSITNDVIKRELDIKAEQLDAVNKAKADVENALHIKIQQLDAVNKAKADVENVLQIKCEQLDAVNKAKADVENVLQIKNEQLDAVNRAKADVESALQIKSEQLDAVNSAKADVEAALQIKVEQLNAVNHVKDDLEIQIEKANEKLAKNDVYIEKCETMIMDLQGQIQKRMELYNALNQEYMKVTESKTWKMTAPLRKLGEKFLRSKE